jgi:outer membrane protein assembly factor BamB
LKGRRQLLVFAGKALLSLDPADGKTQWTAPSKVATTHIPSPVIAGGNVFACAGYGTPCVMLSPDGAALWENKDMMPHMNTPVYEDGYLYGTSGQGGEPGELVCMDAKTGAVAWKQAGFEAGGVVAVDGVLIAIVGKTGEAVMLRINPKAYEELGRVTPLGGRSWTPPAVAAGCLFVRNEKELVCVSLVN